MLENALIAHTYSTAQFKLDRTRVQRGHNTTYFFISHACKHVCACKVVTSSLPCIALVYALDMCTIYVCMSGMDTPNLDYACMRIVSRGQRNKLYKHVYVLRCNPFMIQYIRKSCLRIFYCKAKAIRGLPIIIGNSRISLN